MPPSHPPGRMACGDSEKEHTLGSKNAEGGMSLKDVCLCSLQQTCPSQSPMEAAASVQWTTPKPETILSIQRPEAQCSLVAG